MSSLEIAMIGVGGTVIGILIGAWATYRYSIKLSIANDKRIANRQLRSVFHNELKDIYPNPVNWPKDTLNINPFLKSKFIALQAAVAEFRYYLSTRELEDFDSAWLRYHCSPSYRKDKGYQEYSHYMPFIPTSTVDGKEVTVDNSKTCKETFKHNVDSLLKFANKT